MIEGRTLTLELTEEESNILYHALSLAEEVGGLEDNSNELLKLQRLQIKNIQAQHNNKMGICYNEVREK